MLPSKKIMTGVSTLAVMSYVPTAAFAQVEEIVVTATKRAESTQDIAVSINALGEDTLEQNDVDVFADYLLQLPNVNSAASGPGQGTIYIRGIASSAPSTTTAVAAGIAPNVALYLDEQPVTQVGRNLDIYAVDLNRVEVLPGPQGTLFGASAQAGAIRLITNKPKIGVYEGNANFGLSFTEGGEASYKLEATVNVPIGDRFALRLTGFRDDAGGYIDNVPGVADIRDSAFFRPTGTVRQNGVPVSPAGTSAAFGGRFPLIPDANGLQALDLSGIVGGVENNDAFVEEDFNDTSYTGFRIGAKWEINDDWSFLVANHTQFLESDGVFFADPTIDEDLTSIQRFADDNLSDEVINTAWTLEGRIGALEAVYTGAFNIHNFDQRIDYTDYNFVGFFIPYYVCDYYNVYSGGGLPGPTGNCGDPRLFADIENRTNTQTHELRFNTPAENRLRATFGGFFSDQSNVERVDFTYPGAFTNGNGFLSFPNAPISTAANSDQSPRDPGVVFINDITRTDRQLGAFLEGSFDLIPDRLTVTGGLRYFNVEVDSEGSSNNVTAFFGGVDNDRGFNLGDIFDGNDSFVSLNGPAGNAAANGIDTTVFINDNNGQATANLQRLIDAGAPGGLIAQQQALIDNPFDALDAQVSEGVIFKGNLSWTPTDELLFYFTYSEGFRPGVLNRPAVQLPGVIPPFVDTDELTNFEIGWKTRFFDNTLQFNGSAFLVNIDGLQSTIFAPALTNLLFSANTADAQVLGIEGDFIWAPTALDGFTLNGAFSVLDSEITEILLSDATGEPTIVIAPVGSDLAFAPNFQGNIRGRYEWPERNGFTPYGQLQATYSASSFSDIVTINRAEQDSYFLLGGAAGVNTERWGFEFFIDNITDERAQINNGFGFDRQRITINRPRTYGMRFTVNFGGN